MKLSRRSVLGAGLGWLLFGTLPARASEQGFALLHTSEDHFLELYSDHPLEAARCHKISQRVLQAFDFVCGQCGWSNPDSLRAQPLQFRLLGGHLKVLGYARGPDLMVVRDEYLDNPLSEGTLAHELTHIQDARQSRGNLLPSFLLEGRALTIGHSYRRALGQPANAYDQQMAASAVGFTAAQAEELLSLERGQGWNNQAIGTLLVEYLRTRWQGKGVANINHRLSRVVEKMAAGLDCESAFQKEFAIAYLSVGQAFLHYLSETQGQPQARLERTMWQGVTPVSGLELEEE